MGWLFMRSIAPHRTPREYLNAQFTHTSETMTRTVLRSAVVQMRTYYAALEVLRPDQPREALGIVCLIKYNKRDRGGYVFGYKDMSEDMGPCESECPVAILDLLTPTTNEYALDWRKRCRAFAEQRSSKPTIRNGDRITFSQAIRFNDGTEHRQFEVSLDPAWPRRIRLIAPNGALYRISNLRERAFEVERAKPDNRIRCRTR